MLNDEYLIGTKIAKIDAKNRLWLPKFTNACPHEEIIVASDDDKFRIYSYIYYENFLKQIERAFFFVTSEDDYRKLDKLRQEIFSRILFKAKIDEQRRFLIPSDVAKLHSTDCEVKGMGNYLQLKKL